ncbi:MAG: methionyl-tRNA formyltransferase [Nitrospirota bacterium]
MRIVFMGTPSFAIPSLDAIIDSDHEIAMVVTKTDRPKGRGKVLTPPPVKVRAEEMGLKIYQPFKVGESSFIDKLRELKIEMIVVTAFGQILPLEILNIPEYGCLNLHASLLPRYRGAAPINWAIIRGEKMTGVTTMLMDKGMDTGHIYLQREIEIGDKERAGGLTERLGGIGAKLLIETIDGIKNGRLSPNPQEGEVIYAPIIKKSDARIDWSCRAGDIYNLVRGMDPWPVAYTFYKDERWLVWDVSVKAGSSGNIIGEYGEIEDVTKEGISVRTGDGLVLIKELQPINRRRMKSREYIAGHRIEKGVVLC